jgi:8-oxo-(d)GTP phosphatase
VKSDAPVFAAGAVVWRVLGDVPHVLVIHRARHDDVSLPKGKVDPGETLPETAVREIEEETGLRVALGVPLGVTRYPLASGPEKVVHYWAAEATEKAVLRSTFLPNGEVQALEWLTIPDAKAALTYARDVGVVADFETLVERGVLRTFALVALRHGKAEHKAAPHGDAARELTKTGREQAKAVGRMLAAWRPEQIVTSTATRCRQTVKPLAKLLDLKPKTTDDISQEAWENGSAAVRDVVGKAVRAEKTAVLCSHGPVLPSILREIALATGTPYAQYLSDAGDLDTAGFSAVHLSADHPGAGIIAVETHDPLI